MIHPGVTRSTLVEVLRLLRSIEQASDWPLRRAIQRYVENELSKRILSGNLERGRGIKIDAGESGLTFADMKAAAEPAESPIEQTALAEAEVEYHDKESFTVWVKFRVNETSDDRLKDAYVVIWTTTPWTIPQNRAICFNPQLNYGLYRVTKTPEECWVSEGDLYLVADNLADETFSKAPLNGG